MGQLLMLAWTITEMGVPGMKFTRMWYVIPSLPSHVHLTPALTQLRRTHLGCVVR